MTWFKSQLRPKFITSISVSDAIWRISLQFPLFHSNRSFFLDPFKLSSLPFVPFFIGTMLKHRLFPRLKWSFVLISDCWRARLPETSIFHWAFWQTEIAIINHLKWCLFINILQVFYGCSFSQFKAWIKTYTEKSPQAPISFWLRGFTRFKYIAKERNLYSPQPLSGTLGFWKKCVT